MKRTPGIIGSVIATLALIASCAALFFMPGPRTLVADSPSTFRAEVVETDDSGIATHGLVEFGTQRLKVRRPDGTVAEAANELRAQMELDKKFAVGDTALVVDSGREPLVARDHWRLGWAVFFFALFSIALIAFAGWTGAKALFSFAFSCLAVWKLMIPLALSGWSASMVSFLTVAFLTAAIMFLVAGWTRKCLVAFTGAMLGVFASLALSHVMARLMHVNGATMPFAQQLLYSGYQSLDLRDIFIGAAILASSGAVMDLAMDVAAGMTEVVRHNPDLKFRPLLASGFRMGRAVVGTMTTTLLLAYSGGYLTLLMVFAAQGTKPTDFLNSTLVSAELAKTLVGSLGLILVAPFTALAGALLLTQGHRESRPAS